MPPSAQTPSVTDRLREDVLSGQLAPGTRLVELQLSKRYGVGRTAIRAAILELGKEGLVTREVNRGATVRALGLEEMIEVCDVRARLDGLLARRAAQRGSPQDREALRRLVPGLREAIGRGDEAGFLGLCRTLHEQIARIARHTTAHELAERLRNLSTRPPGRALDTPARAERFLAEHVALIEAVASGQADDAERAARQHVDSIVATLRNEGSI